MSLDWPAFGYALWRVNDQLGIRPEWQLTVLYLESRFNPSAVNSGNCVGLNQFCPPTYPKYVKVPVSEYLTWTASRQLSGPIFNYWSDAIRSFGPIRSAIRLMLSQFGQSLLKTVPELDSVVFSAPSSEYSANCPTAVRGEPCSLDPTLKGYITVRDIANTLTRISQKPAVQDAIARAYQLRPDERPYNPVYGDDYGYAPPTPPSMYIETRPGLIAVTVGALAIAAGWGAHMMRRRTA